MNKLTTIFFAATLFGCAGQSQSLADPATHPGDPEPTAQQEQAPEAEGTVYGADPRLTVYVDGPDPRDPTSDPGMVNAYRLEVVLTNTGDDEVGLEDTQVWFDVWKDDRRVECPAADKQYVDTPDQLAPGDAFTFEADAVCAFPSPGEYEVRAYMSIGTDDEDLDLERHYAGRYVVNR